LAVEGSVDVAKIERAFEDRVAKPLSVSPLAAAEGVIRVINDAMAAAIRTVSLRRGHDPREFALFAFGGAGPLHGVALARELGVPTVIVPYLPGITCALGCIVADVRHDMVQTISKSVDRLQEAEVLAVLERQAAEGISRLKDDRVPVADIQVSHLADMQYEGQTYTVKVPLGLSNLRIEDLRERLHTAFVARFGVDLSRFQAKLINLRTSVVGIRGELDLRRIFSVGHKPVSIDKARLTTRPVRFGRQWIDTPVYDRHALPIGVNIAGPAIFNQMDTTTVAEPDTVCRLDEYGNMIIEVTS
jgi:N-methylhydantoinase A